MDNAYHKDKSNLQFKTIMVNLELLASTLIIIHHISISRDTTSLVHYIKIQIQLNRPKAQFFSAVLRQFTVLKSYVIYE